MQLIEKDVTIYICTFAVVALIISGVSLFLLRRGFWNICLKFIAIGFVVVAFFFSRKQISHLLEFEKLQDEQQASLDDLRSHLKLNLIGNYLFVAFLFFCFLFLLRSLFW
jgi:hypothetical protein